MAGIYVAGGHLSALIKRLFWKWALTDNPKCSKCKGPMHLEREHLYLLPISFDEEHEESAEYYLSNAVRIDSGEEIPTGRRACYINVFRCDDCSHREISVVDFLKVREDELPKSAGCYPYEQFEEFLSEGM